MASAVFDRVAANDKAEWGRMASLMAVIANCHRDPKRAALEPWRFMPKSLRPIKRLSPRKSVEFLADFMGIARPSSEEPTA